MYNRKQRNNSPTLPKIKVKGKPLYSNLKHHSFQSYKLLSMRKEAKNMIERRPHLQVGQHRN